MRNLFIFLFVSIYVFSNHLLALDLNNLELEDGFEISIFAENLDAPRQMAEGKSGTIFVGERGGQILALIDSDFNGQADSKIIIAKDLSYSTGISLFDGDLYFSEISKIWKIENIEQWINNFNQDATLPKKIPIGADIEIKSRKLKALTLFLLANKKEANITPSKPP